MWQSYSSDIFNHVKASKRSIIIYAKSDSCAWCKELDEKTLSNQDVIKMINDNFEAIILNVDKSDENMQVAEKLNIIKLPTLILFNKSGNEAKKLDGYMDAKNLLENLTMIVK